MSGNLEREWTIGPSMKADAKHNPHKNASKQPENPLLQRLYKQVDGMVASRAVLLDHGRGRMDTPEAREDNEFIRCFLRRFVKLRNERADDIKSPEVQQAIEIQTRFFTPFKTFGALCVDGRTLPVLLGGFTGGYGGWLRSPAADIKDFVPALDPDAPGGLVLPEASRFAQQLARTTNRNLKVTQILDSHIDCAARAQEEAARGAEPSDKGLLADVERKLAISLALKAHADQTPEKETVIPIQATFDPRNGFLFMGLEKEEPLRCAREAGGFTREVLTKLADTQEIISTKAIADLPVFQEIFSQHEFVPDLEEDYRNTALKFWKAMEAMWKEMRGDERGPKDDNPPKAILNGKIKQVFGKLPPEELRQRAKILLASAFSGYLNNLTPEGYKYDRHQESCVVVSDGEYGPFGSDGEYQNSFSVAPSSPSMAADVLFTAGIIRNNRGSDRVKSLIASERHQDPKRFRMTTAPVIVEEIVRAPVAESHWQQLADVDWSGLDKIDWMNDMAFKEFRWARGVNIPYDLVGPVDALRKKMAALYQNPESNNTALHLVAGNLVAMAAITDANRRICAIIPFMKGGYARKAK